MYKEVMSEKTIKREDIENLPKEALIEMIVSLSESVNELSKNIEILTDTIRMMNQRRFGIKSEINKSETIQQLALDLVFNEAEELFDDGIEEPKLREAAPRKSKVKGKKLSDLSKITNRREETVEIRKEELDRTFGENNWKLVTYEKVNKLEHHPASFEAVTYNIAVYSVKDEKKNLSEVSMIRAERPFTEVIPGSIVTPSLLASILHGKYVNALPLYRMEKGYEENNVFVNRKNMANWVIRSYERLFKKYIEKMHKELLTHHIIQADETPVQVNKDGRKRGAKSYMWVYRSCDNEDAPKVVIYDYEKDRKAEHPDQFLEGFKGVLVSDGYSAYKKVTKGNSAFKLAGCYVHTKRKAAEYLKSLSKKNIGQGTLAQQFEDWISLIYMAENKAPNDEENRKTKVKQIVDEFFEWLKANENKADPKSAMGEAFTYALNQEEYLRTFLEDAMVPLDNNSAERSIRPFTIGRKNWVMIDTIKGAEASAGIYSIVETGRANQLKLYDYLEYLLEELPKYSDEINGELPDALFPWSEDFPAKLRKTV